MSTRLRRAAALTILVLAALVATDLEASYVHHDDGCKIEIHCLACRLALGSTAVMTGVEAGPAPSPGMVGAAPLTAVITAPQTTPESRRPRGPPSA
jgi:hypothetical protein